MGPLAALIGPTTRDILVNPDGTVWHDSGKGVVRAAISSLPPAVVRQVASMLLAAAGRSVDDAHPIGEGSVNTGMRVSAVLPPLVGPGPALSLRFHLPGAVGWAGFVDAEGNPIEPRLRSLIASGTSMLITGATGAGKTTLLNTLMGLLPTRGQMFYRGEDISAFTLEERVMMGIALVPEKRELFGTMTVEDNLELGGFRQMRLGNRQWRKRIDDVYDLFPRLKERRLQLSGTLSGGERQMLAVGRSLMSNPDVLMLDEPSLGLAPLIVKEIFSIIETLRRTGVTIVLVEQNARAALAVADYGYVLEMGEVSLHGPASELAQDSRVIDTYLGAARKD